MFVNKSLKTFFNAITYEFTSLAEKQTAMLKPGKGTQEDLAASPFSEMQYIITALSLWASEYVYSVLGAARLDPIVSGVKQYLVLPGSGSDGKHFFMNSPILSLHLK